MGTLFIPTRRGASTAGSIDVGPALEKSRVGMLYGRPYPVQFRNQGAFEAWRHALGTTEEWTFWANPETTCWDIRQAVHWQLNNNMLAFRHDSTEAMEQARANAQIQAVAISAHSYRAHGYAQRTARVNGTRSAARTPKVNGTPSAARTAKVDQRGSLGKRGTEIALIRLRRTRCARRCDWREQL